MTSDGRNVADIIYEVGVLVVVLGAVYLSARYLLTTDDWTRGRR